VSKLPSSTRNGFTLIEVLIAMTLLSIMVVLLFASLKICADSWEKGESKIAAVNEVAVVYNFFQRHLSVALPLHNAVTADGLDSLAFRGDKQAVQFVSTFPASAAKSGLQLFAVSLHTIKGERFIEVAMTPFFTPTEGEQWREEKAVLLKRVKDFRLFYFGSEDGMSEGSWRDEWIDQSLLPQLIKVSIELDNGVILPEMLVALRVNSSREPEEMGATDESVNETANPDDETNDEIVQ
jgi:general secretion pathway protein J